MILKNNIEKNLNNIEKNLDNNIEKNLDPRETAKFQQMADNWWDLNGPCKPLHIINKARSEFICKTTNITGKEILDVGCGGGILTESLVNSGAIVTGIDAEPDVIRVAKDHAVANNLDINYQVTTAEGFLAARKNNADRFDCITCMELLEHVPSPASLIKTLAQMLKPNGFLFVSTINRNLKAYVFAILSAEYFLKILPKNTHEYAKFVTLAELGAWFRSANLTLQDASGISFNPFTNNATLINDISVNYITYATKQQITK